MSYRLSVRDGFAAAHRLVGSGGRCESLHGHNFQVILEVSGSELADAGMVMDFGDLKKVLKTVLAELDHTDLNDHPAFAGSSPSSENIARHIWSRAREAVARTGVSVSAVTVKESETAWVKYEPEENLDP